MAAFALLLGAAASCDKKDPEGGSEKEPKVSIVLMPSSLSFDYKGGEQKVVLNSNYDWTIEAPAWLTVSPASGSASDKSVNVSVKAGANNEAARSGEIYVKAGNVRETVKVSQDGGVASLKGKKFIVIANSMVYYGGFVQKGSAGSADPGMFDKMLKAYDMAGTVIDCTQGDHKLSDFIGTCKYCNDKGKGTLDHLAGQNFSSFDYVILSEAGSNTSTFLSDCRTLYKKFPNAKKVYINHVYSVYKGHSNILNSLKTLHEQDGVTIVNCGQLAYDIYTGKVKVPGGNMTYSDRYTFCNHKDSDTHHPNPLMGYIMTQMTFCALTGMDANYADYSSLIKGCNYAAGSTTYANYYNTYYTTAAAHPFMNVVDNDAEMKGIQQLIPQYINKY